jgi:hypothetical protein
VEFSEVKAKYKLKMPDLFKQAGITQPKREWMETEIFIINKHFCLKANSKK